MLEFVDKMARMERQLDRYLPRTSPQSARQGEIDWGLPVVELVPLLDPSLVAPRHLSAYGAVLDAAMVAEDRKAATVFERLALAAPPQHGKTKLTECAIIKALKTCQGLSHAYATYAQLVTDRVERETRRLAEAVGLAIEGTRTDWWIPETKSRIRWTSIGGSLTGDPVSGLLVVDDPFRDFAQARSMIERETRWDWMVQVALRRLHPGACLLEMATRWHEDDITARMIARWGVRYLNIQGTCENDNDGTGRQLGEALWPEERPLDFLELQRQSDPIAYEAQYQGRPRKIGDALFSGDIHWFDDLPDSRLGYREASGADMAYSQRNTADWSVRLRGRRVGDKLYLTHGLRQRVDSTAFLETLKREPSGVRIRFYHGGGGELGVSQLFSRDVPQLHALQATGDKVVRSTGVRKAWNLGNVLLPSESSTYYGTWVKELVQEVGVFCGIGDAHDDQVDALAALYDELFSGHDLSTGVGTTFGKRKLAGGLGGF